MAELRDQIAAAGTDLREGRYAEAIAACREVLSRQPDLLPALGTLAEALGAEGRHDEAAACFRRIIELRPDLGLAHYNYGNAMLVLGRIEEARAAFERAVALMPRDAAAHRALSGLKTYTSSDPQIAQLQTLARGEAFLPEADRAELHFALAKVEADLGRHAAAFAQLARANAIRRRLVQYDEQAELGILKDTAAAFTAEVISAKAGQGHPTEIPVFVVGMPRSGTTLVERVLASHPEVFGAGELTAFGDIAAGGYGPHPMPFAADDLTSQRLRDIGARYLENVQPMAPQSKRIVDKLPANFRFAGLIHLALPGARIIHVRRDPLDTCYSCFAQSFVHNLDFTYELEELGRYYNAYRALMAHWRAVLPEGVFLEVAYETLVGNFEAEARRLLAFCGLAWDDRVMRFHETAGAVQTASAAQARQPLFRSSIGRARPYERELAPLRAILEAGA